MTTPHPPNAPAPTPVTCPGCGKAHAPHPDTRTWCTSACVQAQLAQPIAPAPDTEDGMTQFTKRKRKQANR